jgi:acyl-CoA thioesterase FadM
VTVEALDKIVSQLPFCLERTVRWSECDPAGVVFAGNYYLYALWAYDLYRDRRLAGLTASVTAPMKAFTIVHHAPLRPSDIFAMQVCPTKVGRTTFTIAVDARLEDASIFTAELTLICTSIGKWEACEVPPTYREMLENDRTANAADPIGRG